VARELRMGEHRLDHFRGGTGEPLILLHARRVPGSSPRRHIEGEEIGE